MSDQPKVVSENELDNSGFVADTFQMAMVTDDMKRAMDNMVALGIGPWGIMTLGPHNAEIHLRGERTDCTANLAFAYYNEMMFEIIEPTGGASIYQEFVDAGHSGFHHIAINCTNGTYAKDAEEMKRRGYEEVMGGTAFGVMPFGYFHNGEADSPWIEVLETPEDFESVPEDWYPAPPPGK